MQCVQCGETSPEHAKFCIGCAAPFSKRCATCGTENPPRAKFCAECATPLSTQAPPVVSSQSSAPSPQSPPPHSQPQSAERRQLTVMFCDLVGSTALSAQLDPEDLRTVVQQYQQTCAEVIQRHEGYIAQYLGDGLLVYFGYPTAHEDDARRAVRTGLEIIEALRQRVPSPLAGEPVLSVVEGGQGEGATGKQLQVRIGIHTGVVVIGDMGSSGRTEHLALGETPNVAARLQGLAAPNTVALSPATYRLVSGFFDCQALGAQTLKGIATPLAVYQVVAERETPHRLDAIPVTSQTPLVGREEELALLQRRWEQVKDREGQVVLLSGEPGIGKSRLVRELRTRVAQDQAMRIEFRCSPYYQNSALYPVIEHLQHLLQWHKDDTLQTKLDKLQTTLTWYRFPRADTVALLATLLSVPQPPGAPQLTFSPQRQKQKTEEALIAWLVEEAEHVPLYCVWEDLHWADPSTLELLGRLIDQTPTTRLFMLLTSRPEFTPSWGQHGHFSQLTLSRLGRRQVPHMIEQATGGKSLPTEVLQQIVAKTDGVPLFVEELTKMVLESGLLTEANDHYELRSPLPPLAIPSTLQDSLMARLDRLASVREIAQLGATIGREFSYELLHAVSPLDDQMLQTGLQQLVATELVYQRGTPPQASYIFKHALIQDTAYQSLLKSRRQQLHQQIAQILEERFPDTKATQPELLAHHYTEANLIEQAIPYWQQAGQLAVQRSAHAEAIAHLSKGLEVLTLFPDSPARLQQELTLQLALGPPLVAIKGFAAPAVEGVYTRARELCAQLGETSHFFSVLWGLFAFHVTRAELQIAREIGEQLSRQVRDIQDPTFLLGPHRALGQALLFLGDFSAARVHLEQGITLYEPQHSKALTSLYGRDPGVACLSYLAWTLWLLGYPTQALRRNEEALALARDLGQPFSLAITLIWMAPLHQFRREEQAAREWAEAAIALSSEQGFTQVLAYGDILRGWALVEQEPQEEGIVLMHRGLAAYQAIGGETGRSWMLASLADGYKKVGQLDEGISALAEALELVHKNEERYYEAELYRLKGELTLQQASKEHGAGSGEQEAEGYFLKAIAIAQQQQAKSWELRAAMSLARLWQQQGKRAEAHKLLSEVYNWFTEGFDTKDLQEAKALLDGLAGGA